MDNESQPMGGTLNQPEAYQNRVGAFNEGHGMPTTSPGLAQDQQAMAAGPARVKMSGSQNGMASSQFQSTMGGMFGTANGQANSTYETKKFYEQRPQ